MLLAWSGTILLIVSIGFLIVARQQRTRGIAGIGGLVLGLGVLALAWQNGDLSWSPASAPSSHPHPGQVRTDASAASLSSAKPSSPAARFGPTISAKPPAAARSRTESASAISSVALRKSRNAAGNASANPRAFVGPAEDIYLVLDNSPSMLLPTSAGGMKALAASMAGHLGKGCAYACHERTPMEGSMAHDRDGLLIFLDPSGQRLQTRSPPVQEYSQCFDIPCFGKPGGPRVADGFWLARNYAAVYGGHNIELRIDGETTATRRLIDRLHQRANDRMQVFGFGSGLRWRSWGL
jgi:hypothetical protein